MIFANDAVCFSEGGFFKAILDFPKDYPQKPPKMKFISDIWHPNSQFFHFFENQTCIFPGFFASLSKIASL